MTDLHDALRLLHWARSADQDKKFLGKIWHDSVDPLVDPQMAVLYPDEATKENPNETR